MPTIFKVVLIAAVAVAGAVQPDTLAATKPAEKAQILKAKQVTVLRDSVAYQRKAAWKWQDTMMAKRTPSTFVEQRVRGVGYLRWLVRYWKKLHRSARAKASNPPYKQEWLCIHRYEGSWTDPNAPYYGGLQMDMSFQRAYGWRLLQSKGTADNWTPLEQMWVAVKAHRSGRGFYPWPNTARYCGLI